MARNPDGPIEKMFHRRMLSRWTAAARKAVDADLSVLRAQRQQARQLSIPLQDLTHIADSRLALPRLGSNSFHRPVGTDWAWRPAAWRAALPARGIAPAVNKTALGREVKLFHDCRCTEIALRQVRNKGERDLAPFGIALEVFCFDGNFLSLAIDLPNAACVGLRKRHLIRLTAVITTDFPLTVLARLNIKHGPNTDQSLKRLELEKDEITVDYDLAYGNINETQVERVWVDLMFENPHMNLIRIRDLTFCRYPRAAL